MTGRTLTHLIRLLIVAWTIVGCRGVIGTPAVQSSPPPLRTQPLTAIASPTRAAESTVAESPSAVPTVTSQDATMTPAVIATDWNFAWPEGTSLGSGVYYIDANSALMAFDPVSANANQIATNVHIAKPSPDGRFLLVVGNDGNILVDTITGKARTLSSFRPDSMPGSQWLDGRYFLSQHVSADDFSLRLDVVDTQDDVVVQSYPGVLLEVVAPRAGFWVQYGQGADGQDSLLRVQFNGDSEPILPDYDFVSTLDTGYTPDIVMAPNEKWAAFFDCKEAPDCAIYRVSIDQSQFSAPEALIPINLDVDGNTQLVSVSPDSEYLGAIVGNTLKVFRVASGQEIATIPWGYADPHTYHVWSPDSSSIAFGGRDGSEGSVVIYSLLAQSDMEFSGLSLDRVLFWALP